MAAEPERRVRVDRYRKRRAVFVESDHVARFVSGTIAVVLIAGIALWAYEARERFNVPGDVRPTWFRAIQVVLAQVGVLAATAEAVYLVHFTVTGRTWRRWRGVAIGFAVIAAVWTALWWIDRLLLDSIFL